MKKVMFVIEYRNGEQQRMTVDFNKYIAFVNALTKKIGRGNFRIMPNTITLGTVLVCPRNTIVSKAI
jgi:hypothetical protein